MDSVFMRSPEGEVKEVEAAVGQIALGVRLMFDAGILVKKNTDLQGGIRRNSPRHSPRDRTKIGHAPNRSRKKCITTNPREP